MRVAFPWRPETFPLAKKVEMMDTKACWKISLQLKTAFCFLAGPCVTIKRNEFFLKLNQMLVSVVLQRSSQTLVSPKRTNKIGIAELAPNDIRFTLCIYLVPLQNYHPLTNGITGTTIAIYRSQGSKAVRSLLYGGCFYGEPRTSTHSFSDLCYKVCFMFSASMLPALFCLTRANILGPLFF